MLTISTYALECDVREIYRLKKATHYWEKRVGRKILVGLLVLAMLGTLAISQRHKILISLITSGIQIPQLLDVNPVPGGQPFGDNNHFSIVQLDAKPTQLLSLIHGHAT